MKKLFLVSILFAATIPALADDCFNTPEYKKNAQLFQEANDSNGALIGLAVDYLEKNKGLTFDQALKEFGRFESPETLALDNKLKEIGDKIRPMKPKTKAECVELISLQNKHRVYGKEKIQTAVSQILDQKTKTSCQSQFVENYSAELCFLDPGLFRHFSFVLKIDGEQIFSLIDDYVEDVSIQHIVAPEPSIELPISKQGKKKVSLIGGCKPILNAQKNAEIARLCNFSIGDVQIIKNMEFKED